MPVSSFRWTATPSGNVGVRDTQLEPRLTRLGDVGGGCRAEDDDPGEGELTTELEGLPDRRHTQSGRTGLESRTADVYGTVAVAVRLDDRP